jgi:hypothetical protein
LLLSVPLAGLLEVYMADGIYPAILPNTKAYDIGGGLYSPFNPNLDRYCAHRAIYFGKLNPQTATLWADPATLNPYIATSGNNTWGADAGDEALLLGSGDAALYGVPRGYVACMPSEILVIANTSATVSRLRVVWGTGTMAAAIAAGQYSDTIFANAIVGAALNVVCPLSTPVVPFTVGGLNTKAWVQHWNVTNDATVSFFIGMIGFDHE